MAETYEVNTGARCPYCGHLNRPDDDGRLYDESVSEWECGDCEKPFSVRVYISASWTCKPLPGREALAQSEG